MAQAMGLRMVIQARRCTSRFGDKETCQDLVKSECRGEETDTSEILAWDTGRLLSEWTAHPSPQVWVLCGQRLVAGMELACVDSL